MNNYDDFQNITKLVPLKTDVIDWKKFENTSLSYIFNEIAKTKQNPEYHGEIDVLTHTKMVCEEIVKQPEYKSGSDKDKIILFI